MSGKVALVTGGGGIIGQAIATKLVGLGATVILVGGSAERLEQAQNNVLEKTRVDKGKVTIYSCDVTIKKSVVQMFEALDEQYPDGVDLLVNNACAAVGANETLSEKDLSWAVDFNVVRPFLCAREALKRMESRQEGRIINIGSIIPRSPPLDGAPLTASKLPLMGLTKGLALDASPHNVAVGIIHPEVRSSIIIPDADSRESTEDFLEPEDVANCVATMSSLPYSANVLEMTVTPIGQPCVERG